MDRLDAMSVLIAVAEAGSLSAASRRLGMPLTTVSRKISELESHLKTKLLHRSTRQMMLTDAGRSYLEACKCIIEQVGEAERAATGEYRAPKGDLTVTAPTILGHLHLLPVALEFLAAYPNIDLRLLLSDHILNLFEDRVDLAIRIGILPDSSMIATRVGTIRRVVCASPTYFAGRGRPHKPSDLRDHDCITFDRSASPHAWKFATGDGEIHVPVRSRLTVSTAEAAIAAAVAGVGITRVMSYRMENASRAGALEIVLEAFEPTPLPVNIVYPEQRLLPLKVRAFLDWATPRLKVRLTQQLGRPDNQTITD
jgi:DNA-binding transcriptional LysR family regulator